jgi:hypothetical protein
MSQSPTSLAPDERSCHAACGGNWRAKPLKQRTRSQVKLAFAGQKTESMCQGPNQISKSGLEDLLSTIPLFENYSGPWIEHSIKREGNSISIGVATYPIPVMAFFRSFHDSGLFIPFDWPSWQNEAERICADPSLIQKADLQTIRRLLTTHVRKERFCEGHLSSLCKSGHIVSVLKRLKQLWELGEIETV